MLQDRTAWLLALAAPLAAVAALLGLQSVWAVFLLYHGMLCLLIPALVLRRRGRPWRHQARELAVLDPDGRLPRALVRRSLGAAAALAALPPLALWLAPGLFPEPTRLLGVLEGWGLQGTDIWWALGFLILVGAPAEELFWRGWLHSRLVASRRQGWPAAAALALLFTSYHAVTLHALAPTPTATALMLAAVLAAAGIWCWSRWRWASVWPALLTHAGAALGYGLVAAARLG